MHSIACKLDSAALIAGPDDLQALRGSLLGEAKGATVAGVRVELPSRIGESQRVIHGCGLFGRMSPRVQVLAPWIGGWLFGPSQDAENGDPAHDE